MQKLNEIQCFLLDMDGTVYLGDQMIDGALEFLDYLSSRGKEYLFLTNNSSKNSYSYQKKLADLGCTVDAERIFTSGEATLIYIRQQLQQSTVYLLGTRALEEEFTRGGIRLVRSRGQSPGAVILGFDTTLTYEKLWIACDYIRDGVPYIATHPDLNCPLAGGKLMPDTGAMIAFITAATGRRPYIVGKPNRFIIDALCSKYGLQPDKIAMVGDRLYTDIQTGVNAGITSVLVLSGETTIEEYQQAQIKADYVFASVKELMQAIKSEK